MSDILRQVDEDLRKDKLSKLWKKYGLQVVLLISVMIIITIAFQVKIYIDRSNNEQLVELYINASNVENVKQKLSFYEELINSGNHYVSGMAELSIANLKIENGYLEDGLLKLEMISKNKQYDPIIRDLATYLFLMKKINDLSENEFLNYLNISKINDSKFNFLYKELIAIKKLIDGNIGESKKDFQQLIDLQDTPVDIKIRASKFIRTIN